MDQAEEEFASPACQMHEADPAYMLAPPLPDLAGRPHRLSDLRGRRVFLATWASW